jgi:hypothetical protein
MVKAPRQGPHADEHAPELDALGAIWQERRHFGVPCECRREERVGNGLPVVEREVAQVVPAVCTPHLPEVDDAGVVTTLVVDMRRVQVPMGEYGLIRVKERGVACDRLPYLLSFSSPDYS